MRQRRLSSLTLLLFALVVILPARAEVTRLPPGGDVEQVRCEPDDERSVTFLGPETVRSFAPTQADTDGDGLTDAQELQIGTDPDRVDTDRDFEDDATEVGFFPDFPNDFDQDGIIDALENEYVDHEQDGLTDEYDSATGWQMVPSGFFPHAIANDGVDATRVEVQILNGGSVTEVRVSTSADITGLRLDGVAVDPVVGFELFDDGTYGDRMAGDGIFTRDGLTCVSATTMTVDREFDQVTVTNGQGTVTRDLDFVHYPYAYGRLRLGVVASGLVAPPAPLDTDVQIAGHLINIVDPLLDLEIRRHLELGSSALPTAIQSLYAIFPDAFDFILVFPETPAPGYAGGRERTVRNDVSGIGPGTSLFDDSAVYGSAGRLQSIVARNFDAFGPTLHETMHRWGNHFSQFSAGIGSCASSHWGFSSINGRLGGFDASTLIDEGGEIYSVGRFGIGGYFSDDQLYATFELYVAGLAPQGEVPPVTGFPYIDCSSLACANAPCDRYRFDGGSVTTATIEEIQVLEGGPRMPDFTTSQKNFTMAALVFSHEPLNGAETTYYGAQAERFGGPGVGTPPYSFHEATSGRGTMKSTIDAFRVYRSSGQVGVVGPLNVVGASLGSSFTEPLPAPPEPVLFYNVDDGAGDPPTIFLSREPSGDVRIDWP